MGYSRRTTIWACGMRSDCHRICSRSNSAGKRRRKRSKSAVLLVATSASLLATASAVVWWVPTSLALEARLHHDVIGQEHLQLRHDEARHRQLLATRQPPALGLGQQPLERVEGRCLARQQQRAVTRQAVVPHHLRDHLHAPLRDGVQRHLAGQEGHVDLVALDGLLQRFIRVDRQHAHGAADGAAQFGQQRIPIAARFEGPAQRQDAEAHGRTVGHGGGRLGQGSQRHTQRQGQQDKKTAQESVHVKPEDKFPRTAHGSNMGQRG